MTCIQLYYRHQCKSFSFVVEHYGIAVQLLHYFVKDLLCEGTTGFAFAIKNRAEADFPTLHFQQCDDRCLLQVYSTACSAIDGIEGWHCLVEIDGVGDTSADELVAVASNGNTSDKYFSVRFAEGVLFSRNLLVSRETVKTALLQYQGEGRIGEWLRQSRWINLGLL